MLVVTACASGDDPDRPTVRPVMADVTLAGCGGTRPDEPVTIHVAHTEGLRSGRALEDLAVRFEAAHPAIDVVVDKLTGGFEALMAQWRDAPPASRPDLALLPQHQTQRMVDSGQTVSPDRCIASVVPDMVPSVEAAWTVDGRLRAVPLGVTTPLLLYDRRAFQRAGLDPDDPPATLDEVRAVAEQLVATRATGTGMIVDTGVESGGSWFVEQWAAQAGEASVLPANGRGDREGDGDGSGDHDGDRDGDGRAASVGWDDGHAADWLAWLAAMAQDRLVVNIGAEDDSWDNLSRAVRPDDPAGMTLHSSGALADVQQFLAGAPDPDFELGVAPLPGPGPQPGSLPGGTALWQAAGKPPAQTAAAWQFASYLASPPVNSQWAADTGFVPLGASATALDPLRSAWARDPALRVAYDVLAAADTSPEALGPLSGPAADLHRLLADAVADVLQRGHDPHEALARAAADGDALLAAYNAGAPRRDD